jgi:hypothetical protein
MAKPPTDTPRAAPPEPYDSGDPTQSGAWPPGAEPQGPTVVKRGRDNVTAAGEHIATAPDLDLGPSGGGPIAPKPER